MGLNRYVVEISSVRRIERSWAKEKRRGKEQKQARIPSASCGLQLCILCAAILCAAAIRYPSYP